MSEKSAEPRRPWYEPNGPADNISSKALRERWLSWARLSAAIKDAIRNSNPLPAETPTVNVKNGAREEEALLDLRGFAFRGVRLGRVDLSYCCLDYSDFGRCVFENTSLQFSTIRYSCLDETRWKNVQASPVSMRGTTMREAEITDSFLMNSDLNSVDLSRSRIVNTALTNSDLREVIFDHARLSRVDLRRAFLSDTPVVRRWYAAQEQTDNQSPEWFQAVPAQALESDAVVMVVDDSELTRETLNRQLQHEGYRVILAQDGVEAIRKLRRRMPDLVLLDIKMPRMDGIEVTRQLRRHVGTSALPVVIITSMQDAGLRQEAVDAGATEYFTKPLDDDDLARIRELLATHQRQTASEW